MGKQKPDALEFKTLFFLDDLSFIGLATFNISKTWFLTFLHHFPSSSYD
jgi:hypothetical protein